MHEPGAPGTRATTPADAGDTIVFGGSNGLWLTLAALAALLATLTLWLAANTALAEGAAAGLRALLIGGAFAALLALGAWFMARQRREVTLDASGVTIRAGDGRVRATIAWAEIDRFEERRLPSQPLQTAIVIRTHDGTALLLDPQQVRDIGTLYREAQRRHANATQSPRQ